MHHNHKMNLLCLYVHSLLANKVAGHAIIRLRSKQNGHITVARIDVLSIVAKCRITSRHTRHLKINVSPTPSLR